MAGDEAVFIGVSGFDEQTRKYLEKLEKLDREMNTIIVNKILYEAGNVLANEQKRLLSQNPQYSHFTNYIRTFIKNYGKRKRIHVGYRNETISRHPELLVIEFGRPASLHNSDYAGGANGSGRDKLGRKIGVVQPYPVIRKAWFAKKEEVYNLMSRRIKEEIEKVI